MKILLALIFFSISRCAFTQQMHIGLLTEFDIKKLKINKAIGNYHVMTDSTYLGFANSTDIIDVLYVSPNKMTVNFQGNSYDNINNLFLYALFEEQSIQLTGISPGFNSRQYEGDFEISAAKSGVRVINNIDLEAYLEGVIESEAGSSQHFEYYKVQAIISRTYAKRNEGKHKLDGFQLCDKVHCQVYHNKRLNNPIIDSAVSNTGHQILTNKNDKYAPTFFSANCGGQTCNPSYIWKESIEGLTSFKDTFCVYSRQASWFKSIPYIDWVTFIVKKYNFPIDDSLSLQLLNNFKQDERQAFYIDPIYGIPLKELREKFKLKSTYFSVRKDGEYMIINGRGFGHGVGLCQEGAMKMARTNYTYDQIIKFYFPDYLISKIIYN